MTWRYYAADQSAGAAAVAKGGDWRTWPEDLRIRQVPGGGR